MSILLDICPWDGRDLLTQIYPFYRDASYCNENALGLDKLHLMKVEFHPVL